jgi:DNA-binding HxlR family transcriptional regulator
MYEQKIPVKKRCGIDTAMNIIGGKWKRDILGCLYQGIHRPGLIQNEIKEANPRVINQQLKELLAYGIIERKLYSEKPLRTEYYLSAWGGELLPLLLALNTWGAKYQSACDKKCIA